MADIFCVKGVLVDPISRVKFGASLEIVGGKILNIVHDDSITAPFILPGMVDSHVHIESSMLMPVEFSAAAAKHGTIAAVCDPHEIANVAGVSGVDFMVNDAKNATIKLFFGVPSCVPSSPFDECFQPFTPDVIEGLINRDDLHFLGEMMNFPGVIGGSKSVMGILDVTRKAGKPIDGHAPALSGESLMRYVASGISTDHECFTMAEALEKIALGMKVLIREGSAAKNFEQLKELVRSNPESVMFCTDDCHPDDLKRHHINKFFKWCLEQGYDIFNILQATSVNPVKHYKLNVGLLQTGDSADFIVVDSLVDLNILSTYINGVDVLALKTRVDRISFPKYVFPEPSSFLNMNLDVISKGDKCKVIEIINDELVTNQLLIDVKKDKIVDIDTLNDILKIVVVSRYKPNEYAVGFIKGVGLKRGAIAASIAHDSHHIIAIGTNNSFIEHCIGYILQNRGGVCYDNSNCLYGLPLPVFGLMTNLDVNQAAQKYEEINNKVLADGCRLKAPFMTMAFMSLTVIPNLKITPSGLFDVAKFEPTSSFQ